MPSIYVRIILPVKDGPTPAVDNQSVQIRIEGIDLPGKGCGPSPDSPDGYRNIHVGIPRKNKRDELLGLAPGDSPSVTWTMECTASGTPPDVDFKGPTFRAIRELASSTSRGAPWTRRPSPGFRRAKLWLDAVPPVVVTSALRRGVLVGRLGLTDAKGNPHCASVRAPTIEWSAAPSSAESSCPVFTGH